MNHTAVKFVARPVRRQIRAYPSPFAWRRKALRLTPCVAALCSAGLWLQPVAAQQIVPDGRTATTLSTHSNITDVMTATQRGANAFNSFARFDVNQGSIANLHVPSTASNLINIVSGSASNIHGVLNAVKNGQIDGNVWFANPHGMVVGSTGIINVGSLHLSTPTPGFIDSFFTAPGTPNDGAVAQLLSGNAPHNAQATITVDGTVNAVDTVSVSAGAVKVGGAIYSGARFIGNAPHFTDVVNANGMATASRVVERGGKILIVADGDVGIQGTLNVDGAAGVQAGDVSVRADGQLRLDPGAHISARGVGAASDGGNVNLWADQSALARTGALVDASAGSSGRGGAIEFSARNTVELAGGEFRADGRGAAAGHVLIDPANIVVSANILRTDPGYGTLPNGGSVSGANLTLLANESVTINDNVVVSSRMVGSGDVAVHVSGNSTADSGDITLAAPSITLKSGSQVLAQGGMGWAGGAVTLNAASQPTVSILGYREANASIQIGDATGGTTIRGATVDLKASTDISTKWVYQKSDGGSYLDDPTDLDVAGRTLTLGASTGAEAAVGFLATLVGVNLVHSQAVATSTVLVKAGSTIDSTGDVTLRAENTTTAGAAPDIGISGPGTQVDTPLGLGALYARNKSVATVTVEGNASIKSQNLTVRAHNTAALEAEIASADAGSDSGDIAIALGVTHADIQATALVAQGANIKVTGRVSVAATNVNTFNTSVEAQTGVSGKASAAIAVSEISTKATAELQANVSDATAIEVVAINDNQKNATIANSKVGQSLNDMILAGVKEKFEPLTDPSGVLENFLWDKLLAGKEPDAKVEPKSTPFRIGGAIAVTSSSAEANALIGDNTQLHASDHVAVVARTQATDLQISADASAVSQSRERAGADTARTTFSAGVAIGDYRHDALAKVGQDAVITAPKVGIGADVVIPVRESILTGGNFDRWSGLSTIGSWLDSITNAFGIFNGSSSASSTSDNSDSAIALSGSVNLLTYQHTSRAVLDTGAKINLSGAASGAWSQSFEVVPDDASTTDTDEQIQHDWAFDAPAHLRADRDLTLLFHGGKFLPSGGGSAKGLGLAYTQSRLAGVTETIVREGATIQGVDESASAPDADGLRAWTVDLTRPAGEVQLTAQASDLLISVAASGGFGGSFGLNGAASIVGITNSTRALVDDEAVLKAETVSLLAKDTPVSWSIAGGFNKSSSSGVGIGIGYNSVTTHTYAELADNDGYQAELALARASMTASVGSVLVRDLAVEARSGGRLETIAVTAAVSADSDSSSGGFFSNIKNKYESIQGKLAGLVDIKPGSTSATSGSSQGTGNNAKNTFGLSGAGSGAVNDAELDTVARVEGANITHLLGAGDNTLLVRGVSDMDVVTASGAAALTRANKSSQTGSAAITGSVAVNIIDNATQSILRDSILLNANDVTVQALQGGEQLSIAIGMAIDASNQASKTKSFSAAGSLSLSFVENDVTAQMDDVMLTGQTGVTGRDVDVVAYNRTFIGTGGGALSAGGKKAAGGALTYSDITNTVHASITGGSQLTAIDTVGVAAYNATEIGAGAAYAAISTGSNSNALGGAVVITEITNNTTAAIDGLSSVAASGRVEVLAKDQGTDVLLEDIIEPDSHRENTVAGMDYCGSSSGVASTPTGNCITSVAGIVQATPGGGSSNFGLSFNWSQITNNLTAKVEDATVTADTLAVLAESNTTITGLAVGVGVADKTSAVGSVSVNKINNHIEAAVRAPASNLAFNTVSANTLDLSAKDKSRIDTLAGQVTVSMNGAAVGAAVTYAEISNQAQAQIDGMYVHAPGSVMLTSGNDARIRTLAAAGSVVTGGSSPAISASIAVNYIGNTTESRVNHAHIDDSVGGSNAVTVAAQDTSEIQSLAGSVSVSGTSAAGGGAFAYNQIGNTVTGAIDNSTLIDAARLDVSANQTSKIQNITAAVGAGQTLAISGSVSLNQIGRYGDSGNPDEDGNVTSARISHTSVSNGATAATVKATDASSIESLAGAVSISIGSAAVGGAVADNAIRNVVKATVSDAAFVGSSDLTVEASNGSTIDSLSVAGAGAATGAVAGSASSNRTENRTIGDIAGSAMTGSSASLRVAALDSAAIRSLAGAVGIGGSAGVGAAVAVNKIDNTTDAQVTGIRALTSGYEVSDLIVLGDSTARIQTLAAGVGAGADVGVAGSAAINLIGSNTRASIADGAKVQASGSVAVVAESDDTIEVAAGAAGVGLAAAGVAASTAVNQINGTTEALIAGANTEVQARAFTGAGFLVDTGELSGEVDLAGIVGGTTTSINLAGMRQQETVKGLAVSASSTHQVRTTAVNIAAGLYAGVGATANVNVISGNTRASIVDARINGGDNSGAGAAQQVLVRAGDHAYSNTFIGGVSGGLAGVGAAADVNVFDRNTLASVVGSTVDAKGQTEVEAWSTQGDSSLVVGLSGGGFAAVGTGALAKFTSRTEAWTDGATLRVGALDVIADHDTHMFLSAGAVALGGVAFAGTFAVGLDSSITKAHVDGGSVDAPGSIAVKAQSDTELQNIGVSGAGAGGTAVAGMAVIALIGNTTQSYVTGARIGSVGTPAGGLAVTAKDVVTVDNKAGAAAGGGSAGIGLGAGVTKIANTVSAYVADSDVDVAGNFVVDALAQRDLYTFAATAGVSAGFSLAGAAGVTIVGTTLSDEAKKELGTDTDSQVNDFANKNRLSSGGNIDTNDNFSQSDIDAINASAKSSTSSNLTSSSLASGSLNQRTKTQVSGGAGHHVTAGGDVQVSAHQQDRAAMQVGSVAVGVVALGGSVGFLDITNNVESEVSGGLQLTSTGGKIEVTAQAGKLTGGTAADVQTLQGSGGIVGLGAAVSKVNLTNNVTATIGRGTTIESLAGDVSVLAADTSDVNAQAVGLNAGLVGAGVTIATANKSGTTAAIIGDTAATGGVTHMTLSNDMLLVQAQRSGRVRADATASAGGILAGSGADATATDSGTVQALAGHAVHVDSAGGTVKLEAMATPQTHAQALGVNVGEGSVGASLATAKSDATVSAGLGAGVVITAAQLEVLATRNLGAAPSALAHATGASGGLLLGVNATLAKADSAGTTRAAVGDESTLTISGATTVKADGTSQQTSSGLGFSFGFIALGADYSRATSDTLTEAILGDEVKVTGGSLRVIATGADTNYAYGLAGSGGVASAPFSEVATTSNSRSFAATGSGDNTDDANGNARKVEVYSLEVTASHVAQFDSWIDSTNASLVGASGAKATNSADARSTASIGTSGYVESDNINLQASNTVTKTSPGPVTTKIPGLDRNVPGWNVNSSSGGLADIPAAGSTTTITTNATTEIGAGAHLEQTGDRKAPGDFTVGASNTVNARDRVTMGSGGAVSAASGKSAILAQDNTTTVYVGTLADVSSVGDIVMTARSVADLSTQTAVDVYGLVGVAPFGESLSRFMSHDKIDIAGLARLDSQRDIRLSAGADNLQVTARSDVFNNTAIPANRDPVADAIVQSDSLIDISAGAALTAVRDVYLYAEKGTAGALGVGIGKDIYRETLAAIASAVSNFFGGGDVSFETHTGRSITTQTSGVVVDGSVLVGTQRNQKLILDVDTSIDPGNNNTWNYKTTVKTDGFASLSDTTKGIAEDINKRIQYLTSLADQYAGSAGAVAYLAEIAFLKQKLVNLGLATKNSDGEIILGSGGGTGQSEYQIAVALRDSISDSRSYTQNTQLPPVDADLNLAQSQLDTANTNLAYHETRLLELERWSTEAAKAANQQSATIIADAKTAVFNAEESLVAAAVTGFIRQCPTATCQATPDAAIGATETISYNSDVVVPAQASRDDLGAQKATIEGNIADYTSAINTLNTKIGPPTGLETTPITGPTAKFITVPAITAQLGSVHVRGDQLTGEGAVRVPGDASVTITNNTPAYLLVQDITIDADAARLTFNGVDVQTLTDINRLNNGAQAKFKTLIAGGASAAPPEVLIRSNFEPDLPVPVLSGAGSVGGAAPEIQLIGNISNGRGLVSVTSKAGSILSQGSIYAETIDVHADNGDFVHSYSDDVADSFFHTSGDPRNIYNTAVANPAQLTPLYPGGIVANGSVFLAARHLNINGLVQSGIASFDLTLPAGGATLTGSAVNLGVDAGLLTGLKDAYGLGGPAMPTLQNDANLVVTYNVVKDRLEVSELFAQAYSATAQGASNNPKGSYALIDDYGNIGVRYDTVTDRYVVDGTSVAGGYIQLVGQIMNTANPAARTGTGELRVLDGYGQINITNLSGRDVVLGKLDAGRGIAGVVDITDIQYVDGDEVAHSIHSTITRENGAVRFEQKGQWAMGGNGLPTVFDDNWTGISTTSSVAGAAGFSGSPISGRSGQSATYTPQPGLDYVYETGSDASIKEYYSYSGRNFLGLIDLGGNVNQYRVGPPVRVQPERALEEGKYVTGGNSLTAPYHEGPIIQQILLDTSKPPTLVVTKDYSVCDPWFCITQKYYKDWNLTTPIKTIDRHLMRADSPIKVTFIGEDTGSITVNSARNVLLTGQINNMSGATTIVAGNSGTGVLVANQNIVQANDTALIATKDLRLLASGSVGLPTGASTAAGPDIQGALQVAVSGSVQAAAANGNVLLKQTLGNLTLAGATAAGTASSMMGRIVLQADGNIDALAPTSIIQGNSIELYSENGSIGSIASPLNLNVGFSADPQLRRYYGLKAAAMSDIGIASDSWAGNTGGHLLVNSVITAPTGDVKLTAKGSIIDNNPFATTDTRTQAELAALWDELRLRGDLAKDKLNDAVAAFENGKNNRYQLYWQLRMRQPDGGSAYDPNYQFTVTAQERGALVASGLDNAQIAQFGVDRTAQYHDLHAEVGGLTSSYQGPSFDSNRVMTDPGFRYDASVLTGTGEEAQIRKGSSWSDSALALSVGAGLLKNITDTVTTIKEPNVQARNVTLVAGSDIGSLDASLVINLFDHLALANQTTRTNEEEARLTAEKVALAAAERGDATSDARNVITIVQPRPFNLVTDVTTGSGTLFANALSGFAFIGSEQDLWIDQVTATKDIRIKTAGSLVNASRTGAPNVVGNNLILEAANGGIGSSPVPPATPDGFSTGEVTSMLRIQPANGAGVIARAASDIWIEAPADLSVDTMFSRTDIRLDVVGSILNFHAGESMIAPTINLRSNSLRLTSQTGAIGSLLNPLDVGVNPRGQITALASTFGRGVYLNGPSEENFNIGSVLSGDAVNLSSASTMRIDGLVSGPGPISLVSGGLMTLTSSADVHATVLGLFLQAGALTMSDANDGVHAARMRVDVGTIDIETTGDALITGIETGNSTESAIKLVSTAGRILDNGDTRLDIIADTPPSATLSIFGALGIGDNPLDVRLLNLQADSGGVVDIAVQDSVNIVAINAADRVLFSAGGDITGGAITATGTGNHPDQSVSVTSVAGGVHLASVAGVGDVTISGQDPIQLASVASSGGSVGILSSANVVLGSGTAAGAVQVESTAGDIVAGAITADRISLRGVGEVSGGTLRASSQLNLEGRTVSAQAIGGPGQVRANATAYGGGTADTIDLVLSNPGSGFVFQNLLTQVGSVDIVSGAFAVDHFVVTNFARVNNPQTHLVIDQINRSIQPADVQLFTGGAGFGLSLFDNHVLTDALVVFRSSLHDVITPDGGNVSALEEGYNNLARTWTQVPSAPPRSAPQVSLLINYFGNPVGLTGNRKDGTCPARPDLQECAK